MKANEIHPFGQFMVFGACAVLVWLAGTAPADAGTLILASPITLANQNSSVTVDPNSSSGVSNWTVEGTNQLNQQWFWYRVGSGTTGTQASIDTLSAPTITKSGSSQATISYAGSNGLAISVQYTLTGFPTGSGNSDLSEVISISNTSSSALPVHFYQYSNFVLGGSTTSNTVAFQNPNDVLQQSISGPAMAETVIAPKPNFREDDYASSLLNSIENTPGYTLSQPNNNTPDPGVGPGDVAWAYQWDRTIAPNSTFIISKDKQISGVLPSVPEPSTAALALAGLIALIGVAARRARCK